MMVSVIAASNQLRLHRRSFLPAKFPTVFILCPATRQFPLGNWKNQTALIPESLFAHSAAVARRCRITENQDSSALEQEVLEFMLHSDEPDKFPSRKQLIEAGRSDLADSILRRGGWMTRGWDSASQDELDNPEFNYLVRKWDYISYQTALEKEQQCGLKVNGAEHSDLSSPELKIPEILIRQHNELESTSASEGDLNESSDPLPSSSARSLEVAADGCYGVEGILNGLKKQRNYSRGPPLERKSDTLSKTLHGQHTKVLDAADSFYPHKHETSLSLENSTTSSQDSILSSPRRVNNSNSTLKINGVKCSLQPDAWRRWRTERSGFSDSEFEAAEIDFDDGGKGRSSDSETSKMNAPKKGNKIEHAKMIDDKCICKGSGDKIRNRIQNLESELSSAAENISHKAWEHLPKDLRNLSDDWEFKENAIMKAQDRLRTLRARFGVLEGKVSLAQIGSQKVIDEKHKRINDARKALKLLRNTCIIWPNSASKVLLTGSFDGWSTQRKMEKLSNGTFCVWLRLYPGRYEIKFIVDGMWKVDLLRPVFSDSGNENNLVIIS